MSSVLAQFYMVETLRIQYNGNPPEALRVKFAPVQGEPFGTATPQGTLEMLIANSAAAKVFHDAPMGQKFNIEINAVEE